MTAVPEPAGSSIDLAAAATATRHVRLPTGAIATLGLGELYEVGRVTGHRWDALGAALQGPEGPLVAVAIAWVLVRRLEPAVTWDEALSWRVEIVLEGTPRPPSRGPARRKS